MPIFYIYTRSPLTPDRMYHYHKYDGCNLVIVIVEYSYQDDFIDINDVLTKMNIFDVTLELPQS